MHTTEERGNENIKKYNYFAFKPLFIFEDSFDILSIFKSQSLNKDSGFILKKTICSKWNILSLKKKNQKNYIKTLKKLKNVSEQFFDLVKDPPTCRVISLKAEQETQSSLEITEAC